MKFNKNVSLECQIILAAELKEYERRFKDMTSEERHLLHMWVRNGNSPYDNGDYVCDDSGFPVDFISTLRFWSDMQEYYNTLSKEEQREFRGEHDSTAYDDIPERSDNDEFFIPEELWERIETEVPF